MFKKFENAVLNGIRSPMQRRFILLGTLVGFILSIMMIAPSKMVLAKMLPGKNNDTFTIYATLANGSSIAQTKQVTDCIVSYVQKEKEVLDTEVFLGMGSPLDFAGLIKGSHFKNSENVAEVVLNLSKKHDRVEPSFMMVQRMRPTIQKNCEAIYKDTSISFVEPPAGPPVMAAIVAEVYGNNPNGIRHLASRNNILYLAFEGMQISVKNSDKYNDQVPIYLSLSRESKKFSSKNINSLKAKLATLKLMNKMGMMIPITELVTITPKKSNPLIMSKNLHQMTNVMAETDMVSQVYPLMDARDVILSTFSDQYEIEKIGLFNLKLIDKETLEVYELIWDGEMEVTLDTFVELGAAFISALILIFLLMVIYYKSYALSGIILLGSFLSIIGVIVGHWIMDLFTPDTFFLTATSLIGFIALIGISSRNSLLLIDFTKSLMDKKGMHKEEAIAYATATRAKPIFLTAAAIILASTLLAGDAVFGGLGVALIFGTIAAVVASLIIVPVLLQITDLEKHFHFHEKKAVSVNDPL